MRIYTLTLNPAYDIHAYAQDFTPFHENIADVISREAGGKGVNISRALRSVDVPNTAVVILGADNAEEFRQQLVRADLECILLEKPGRIRENLTLHCGNGPETRISFSGFTVGDTVLDEIASQLPIDEETFITMTGRIAPGMTMERVKQFLKDAKSLGAKIVIDSRSFSLADIMEVQPWLIKPNQEEISAYSGISMENTSDALKTARGLAQHGIENVMVSLGEQGAVLATKGKAFFARPPKIQAVSTIGAGDSSIAGFLTAVWQGRGPAERLACAVAFGTAACLTEGTQPPVKSCIERILPQINVTAVIL